MIYGFITGDPENGEDCVMELRNKLVWTIAEVAKWKHDYPIYGEFVKCKSYNCVREVKSDHHDYYPEIEPFLWNIKGWKSVSRKEIIDICKRRNWKLNVKGYEW